MDKYVRDNIPIEMGISGRIDLRPNTNDSFLKCTTLPCGLPPVLPTLKDELEVYLTNPQNLSSRDLIDAQNFFPRKPNPYSLLVANPSLHETTLQVNKDLISGEEFGFSEVPIDGSLLTAKNSTSLNRAPGPISEITTGSSTNYPFWPGGLEEPTFDDLDTIVNINFQDLEVNPPGLLSGVNFKDEELEDTSTIRSTNILKFSDVLDFDIDLSDTEVEDVVDRPYLIQEDIPNYHNDQEDIDPSLINAPTIPVLNITEEPVGIKPQYSEWIEVIDVSKPVVDFYKKIPNMAHKWSFELDTFQKQAILHLENHDSVFVAAHTSAGKTVVAEYAIAMSQKHMTRTIYTSPIKALSNQKFRDFSDKFDVGLLTGDVQLRPEASCLIMTTEILQSMLYKGSDIIRDLEWVIFDEVHYINDAQRGVVWEEVLIMLPKHVNIILLSATVPNTTEFADWIGRTKKKKIYVISTKKRPVPLEHYLYTGSNGKTRNDCFKLVDSSNNLLNESYIAAINAKKSNSKAKDIRSSSKSGNDKNIYVTLIEYLRRKDLLPVVCFTLSRKRCDTNADLLSSVDFTTAVEKGEIRYFTQKCLSKLKGPDKKIPQVNRMRELLERGLAVHHSGILPILKEVVEMLFHKGLVKMLFATETFAMGVNMPTRTVVFDNIRKHDGISFRDLLPGEYIQMAGRAGRRGHDTIGTVMLLCKSEIPELSDLHRMMLGKPTRLESRFRITYGMILNLLRVRRLRVEDMMKRSFDEVGFQRNFTSNEDKLELRTKNLHSCPDLKCETCLKDIKELYSTARTFLELRHELWNYGLKPYPSVSKTICPGRVIVIYSLHQEKAAFAIAVVLTSSSKVKNKDLTVFTLSDKGDKSSTNSMLFTDVEEKFKVLALSGNDFHSYQSYAHQSYFDISYEDIVHITSKTIKVDGEKIINDIKKRQIPRFRDDPPWQSTINAAQELTSMIKNTSSLKFVKFAEAFALKGMNLVLKIQSSEYLLDLIQSKFECSKCFSFQSHLEQAYEKFKLEKEIESLQYLISEDSLKHLQDYKCMLLVLCDLGYIDETKTVEMKGRVACEMGTHELMITELVYDNVFMPLQPEEIAALLSCLVFQQKTECQPSLTPTLSEGLEKIVNVAKRIGKAQKKSGLAEPVGDFVDQFKFGLTEVVYKWAKGLSFEKIAQLTDVQEGIIVKCIQRLDETLRDVKSVARIVGDPVLSSKMDAASVCIRRDIVFAASLYTQ